MKWFSSLLVFFGLLLFNLLTLSQEFNLWETQSSFITGFGKTVSFYEDLFNGDLYSVVYPAGIKKSTDGGLNWEYVNEEIANQPISCVAVNQNGILFAGTNGNEIYISTDGGANWKMNNTGIEGNPNNKNRIKINFIKVDKLNNVLCGGTKGLYRYDSANDVWVFVDTKNQPAHPLDPSIDEARILLIDDGFMVIGFNTAYSVWMSNDYGETWQEFPIPWQDPRWDSHVSYISAVKVKEDEYVFLVGGYIMYYDRTNNKATLQSQTPPVYITGLTSDHEGNIYYLDKDGIVKKSTDKGLTWNDFGFDELVRYTYDALFQTSDGKILVGSEGIGAFMFSEHWENCLPINAAERLNPSYLNSFALGTNNDLYVVKDATLLKSDDEGKTWEEVNILTQYGVGYIYSDQEGFMLACDAWFDGDARLSLSYDNGKNWNEKNINPQEKGIRDVLKVGETIMIVFGQDNQSIWRSTNLGTDWEEISFGFEQELSFQKFYADLNGDIYASAGGWIIKTVDKGDTWEKVTPWEYDEWRWMPSLIVTEENTIITMYGRGAIKLSRGNYSEWYQHEVMTPIANYLQADNGLIYLGFNYIGFLDGNYWLKVDTLNFHADISIIKKDKNGNLFAAANGSIYKSSRNTGNKLMDTPSEVYFRRGTDFNKVLWKDNSNDENGFIIIRRRDDTIFYETIATVGENQTYYYDYEFDNGMDYSYRVLAYNDTNFSQPSEDAQFTTDIHDEVLNLCWELSQNYPNPFNPTTQIKYTVAEASNVKLILYDLLGREIETIVNKYHVPGNYSIKFDGNELSSGIYFYKLEAENFKDFRKMVLMK